MCYKWCTIFQSCMNPKFIRINHRCSQEEGRGGQRELRNRAPPPPKKKKKPKQQQQQKKKQLKDPTF